MLLDVCRRGDGRRSGEGDKEALCWGGNRLEMATCEPEGLQKGFTPGLKWKGRPGPFPGLLELAVKTAVREGEGRVCVWGRGWGLAPPGTLGNLSCLGEDSHLPLLPQASSGLLDCQSTRGGLGPGVPTEESGEK